MAYEDKIKELEDEIARTKKNKATELHIGILKAKIAELRERDVTLKKGKAKGLGFGVKKTGHATVVLVGLPSVGKSTLINALTNASSKVGAYDFTTLDVIPGMMSYGGVEHSAPRPARTDNRRSRRERSRQRSTVDGPQRGHGLDSP